MQPSHSPLQMPSDGTAEKASSVSTARAPHAMLYSGKKEWSLQEAATFATASATPLLACMVWSSCWGRAGKALTRHSKVHCGARPVPGKGQVRIHTPLQQLSVQNQTDFLHHHTSLDPAYCLLGLMANPQTVPRFWENNLFFYFTSKNLPNNGANWEGQRER